MTKSARDHGLEFAEDDHTIRLVPTAQGGLGAKVKSLSTREEKA
jgi:hypothetical protein